MLDGSDSSFTSMRDRQEPDGIDLAQVILLVIEKGINVHFMDFMEAINNQ